MSEDIQTQPSPEALYWTKILAKSKESGVSQKIFCLKTGVDYTEFKKWRTILRPKQKSKASKALGFKAVKLKKPAATKRKPSIRIEVGKFVIGVCPGFDAETLKAVVAALT